MLLNKIKSPHLALGATSEDSKIQTLSINEDSGKRIELTYGLDGTFCKFKERMSAEQTTSIRNFRTILKSSSLIGGASLLNILIGMVRTKFVAVLLGPTGVGLIGIYGQITSLVSTVTSMGIGSSGVRQIAEAQGTGDQDRIARTVKTLRLTVWLTGLLGMLTMILGCTLFSRSAFGTDGYALPIALIGGTVLLGNIALGQSCILQGTRRIRDLATVSIIGALSGTAISIPCYYFWGQKGIVASLILISVAALVTSWWYARRVAIKPVTMSFRESRAEAAQLLHFGMPLMFASMMIALSGYLIRALLVRQIGLDGVGIWQAAFSLSGVLVGFVLGAMGADYYPRLTAVAGDNVQVGEEVNAQTEVALLLAVPGLAATIIFAPLVITIFYSGKFDAAVDILRWSVYGIFGQVVSWPLGFVILAKGMGKTFFCTEAFSNALYVFSVWFCTRIWGLPGAGIAFLLLYIVYTPLVYTVAYAISRSAWTRTNIVHISIFGTLLILVGLISALVAIPWVRWTNNLLILAAVSIYCFKRLLHKSGITVGALWTKLF